MIPVITIVGRPNVGKSTLFNGLTKSTDALVADIPGVTRDRIYGQLTHNDCPYFIIDTGGLSGEHYTDKLGEQTKLAIEEASLVLFVVDAADGCMVEDEKIALFLRRYNKPVILVVNKMDVGKAQMQSTEFAQLGFEHIVDISAAHRRGLTDILDQLDDRFGGLVEQTTDEISEDVIKLAIIGRPNVGKSTLINRITASERVVTSNVPGTTLDKVLVPFEANGQDFVLIDTAGIRRKRSITEKLEIFSVIKSFQAIEEANVVIMVLDGTEGLTDQDIRILQMAVKAGKGILFAVNKWDSVDKSERVDLKEKIADKLHFISYVPIHYISALHGTEVGHLLPSIQRIFKSARADHSTSELNQMLKKFTTQTPPPSHQGRPIKLRYAHQGGKNPPVIVIHGNQTDKLNETYKRYLMNQFIKTLKVFGSPIVLRFVSSDNPYKDKKNVLTDRQKKKRQRMIKHHKRK